MTIITFICQDPPIGFRTSTRLDIQWERMSEHFIWRRNTLMQRATKEALRRRRLSTRLQHDSPLYTPATTSRIGTLPKPVPYECFQGYMSSSPSVFAATGGGPIPHLAPPAIPVREIAGNTPSSSQLPFLMLCPAYLVTPSHDRVSFRRDTDIPRLSLLLASIGTTYTP